MVVMFGIVLLIIGAVFTRAAIRDALNASVARQGRRR